MSRSRPAAQSMRAVFRPDEVVGGALQRARAMPLPHFIGRVYALLLTTAMARARKLRNASPARALKRVLSNA